MPPLRCPLATCLLHHPHPRPSSSLLPPRLLRPLHTSPSLRIRQPPLIANPRAHGPTPTFPKPKKLPPKQSGGDYSELELECAKFPAIVKRPTLVNQDSARDLVRAWGIDKMGLDSEGGVTVIDAYAGAGGITRALLELPNVKRVIAIEEGFRYMPLLETAKSRETDPDRLTILQRDPYTWEVYTEMEELGLLKDVQKRPWGEVNDTLFLAAQLPSNRHGEQLFYQLQAASASGGKMWLYRYGRFQSGYLGPKGYWDRVQAEIGTTAHHKLAVLLAALVDIERIELLGGLVPPERHFHKPQRDPSLHSAVRTTPKVKLPVQEFDSLAYIAKTLFVAKNTSWEKAISNLATGAANLVPKMRAAGMPAADVTVNQLTVEQWSIIANVYHDWPFRPSHYVEVDEWAPEQ